MSLARIATIARFEWRGAVLRPGFWIAALGLPLSMLFYVVILTRVVPGDPTHAGAVARSAMAAVNPKAARIFFASPLLIGLMLQMVTAGASFLYAMVEERETRAGEVLLASARADEILAGKFVGIGAAGLVQLAFWLAIGAAAVAAAGPVPAALLPPAGAVAAAVGFSLLGYAFCGSVLLAAACTGGTSRDGQQVFSACFLLMVIPFTFTSSIVVREPAGVVAQGLSWFPFTGPLVVPLRILIDPASTSPLEAVGIVASLLLATACVLRVAPRLYRLSTVSVGTPIRLREALRQARLAVGGGRG